MRPLPHMKKILRAIVLAVVSPFSGRIWGRGVVRDHVSLISSQADDSDWLQASLRAQLDVRPMGRVEL